MSITVLIHSSKTMRPPEVNTTACIPLLINKAQPLAACLQALTTTQLQTLMNISSPLSHKVHDTIMAWNADPNQQSLAIDSFIGDIYSGLRASTLSEDDRDYAQQTLRILSGLYGILRPYDGVRPYRLEMGYKLPNQSSDNLYKYWGSDIAKALSKEGLVVNLSAAEYTKTVMPYIDITRVVTPRFLTANPKSATFSQVIVHTKIARGAFARWLMISRITSLSEMMQFNDLNYHYDTALSTSSEPTFVCRTFGGIGLSMRLQKI